MNHFLVLKRVLVTSIATIAIWLPNFAYSCTSLLYKDANGAPYAGRTMELPYEVTYIPNGNDFNSKTNNHSTLSFQAKFGFMSLTIPEPINKSLKVVEGLNDQGLSFSVLAFTSTQVPKGMVAKTQKVLAAIDLGAWTLSQFKTVAEVKTALEEQPVLVTALLSLGILNPPFHYALHDTSGSSLAIEFSKGKQTIIDNPIGVMTNGPEFARHVTNLNNYTFLNNKDQSDSKFSNINFKQPESGIATAILPASNTSVGRYVRAVYYSQLTDKAQYPDNAINTLAHLMNNFDRPRGISIDDRFKCEIENIEAPCVEDNHTYTTEYTSWTALSDFHRLKFNVRSSNSLNYIRFDLAKSVEQKSSKSIELKISG